MNNLMASLGLENVEADPNAIPDGKYDGEVFKSEYVIFPTKGTLNHVITYKVTDGSHMGAQRQEVFTLGTDPVDAQGNPTKNVNEVASYTPSMTDVAKTWYKKRFVDLGVPEDKIPSLSPEALVGLAVTFGVKKNGQWTNVNFVERRDVTASTTASEPVQTGSITSLGL